MRTRADVRAGITLFEAVAAMAIVGLTAVGALEAVASGMRTAERSRRALEAQALAEQRLDWIDLLNEQQLRALPDTVTKGEFGAPFAEYSWTTASAPVSTQPGVYDVRVTVAWPDHTYQLRTYAYRRPALASPGRAR